MIISLEFFCVHFNMTSSHTKHKYMNPVCFQNVHFMGILHNVHGKLSFLMSTLAGLNMANDTVANATKMVRLATRSFQAVAKLATSSN